MSSISHLCEPTTLLLTWQGLESASEPQARHRYVVGELTPSADRTTAKLRYLRESDDFKNAARYGFQGHPAFPLPSKETEISDVLPTFLRRLPPRKREDFPTFLQRHMLPYPFELSDFALLGYTGARLPSDGFALSPVFDCSDIPCELITDLAGTRYHVTQADVDAVQIGDVATLVAETDNEFDPEAIRVEIGGKKFGYINRVIKSNINAWIGCANVTATVCKKNGTPERPLIYVRIAAIPRQGN